MSQLRLILGDEDFVFSDVDVLLHGIMAAEFGEHRYLGIHVDEPHLCPSKTHGSLYFITPDGFYSPKRDAQLSLPKIIAKGNINICTQGT